MKMIYNGAPIKNLNIHTDTDSATMVASDLQAGVTAFARGQKITGTGKAFEFANYGHLETNMGRYVPSNINVIELASTVYPIRLSSNLADLNGLDFSIGQKIAIVTIDGVEYDLTVSIISNTLKVSCDKTFNLQVFYGKDNYV